MTNRINAVRSFFRQQGLTYTTQLHIVDAKIKRYLQAVRKVLSGYQRRLVRGEGVPAEIARCVQLERRYGRALDRGRTAPLAVVRIDAAMGYGCFAEKDLKPGAFLGEYTGEVMLPSRRRGEVDPSQGSVYLRTYPPLAVQSCQEGGRPIFPQFAMDLVIDACTLGNEMRYINHLDEGVVIRYPDGRVAEGPNVVVETCFRRGAWRVFHTARRAICKGDELRVAYREGYFERLAIRRMNNLFTLNDRGAVLPVLLQPSGG